jgi:hypothetical protein
VTEWQQIFYGFIPLSRGRDVDSVLGLTSWLARLSRRRWQMMRLSLNAQAQVKPRDAEDDLVIHDSGCKHDHEHRFLDISITSGVVMFPAYT